MSASCDLSGKHFGRLTVVSRDYTSKGARVKWKCLCACGKSVSVSACHLRSGHTQSCGCYKKDRIVETQLKHGLTGSTEYYVWQNMKRRCFNPSNKRYENYGGRGITVCDRWKDSFENFLEDMGNCPEGYTLDRINNDGNYEPDNCRWADSLTQNRNRSISRAVSFLGRLTPIVDLASFFGVKYRTLHRQISKYGEESLFPYLSGKLGGDFSRLASDWKESA